MRRILASKIGAAGRNVPAGHRIRARQPEKEHPMLRKFAVALLAASVFTAPVFAQGSGAPANPPAKTESKSGTAPKVVTANPDLKAAKVKTSKRYARHRVKHVQHVAQVKRVRHVKTAHAMTHGTAKVHQAVTKSTTGQNGANGASGAMSAPKTKSNVN
jgi:hypothetical protein